jgi:hypothetical protein
MFKFSQIALFSAVNLVGIFVLPASAVLINPGDSDIPISGTTLAARPELADTDLGTITTPFTLQTSDGATVDGTLIAFVGREDVSGTLDFYYRVEDNDPVGTIAAPPPFIITLGMNDFAGFTTDMDYRTDSVGILGPVAASSSSDGSEVAFYFAGNLGPGEETYTMFIKTNAINYGLGETDGEVLGSKGNGPDLDIGQSFEPLPAPEPAALSLIAPLLLVRRRAKLPIFADNN